MLPRAARLKRNRDFQSVYRARRFWNSTHFTLYVRAARGPNAADEAVYPVKARPRARLGFVISRKVAKRAHDRNRLKRRLREIARCDLLPQMSMNRSYDMLVVARQAADTLCFGDLSDEVRSLFQAAGLFADPK